MTYCREIVAHLDSEFRKNLYPNEIPALWKDTPNLIYRIGLALEPWPEIENWIEQNKLDAFFLHRPWKVAKYLIPAHVGIIAYHLPFDEHLTIGYNKHLARQLQVLAPESFGIKEGRPIGMVGELSQTSDVFICKQVENLFGGVEEVFQIKNTDVNCIACVGAMTDDLIRKAANSGVQMYITGQIRKPALETAIQSGMSIIAVGHQRSEYYGLKLLANLLKEKWPHLKITNHNSLD